MSIRIMTRVWESEQKTATHKLVLLAFADFANDDGVCWPSVNTVALKSQLSRRQTQRIIHDLVDYQMLELVDPPERHRTPTYKVRGDKLTPLEGLGVTSEQGGVTNATPRGDIRDTPLHIKEPSQEPSEEPSRENLSLKEQQLRQNYVQSQKRKVAR